MRRSLSADGSHHHFIMRSLAVEESRDKDVTSRDKDVSSSRDPITPNRDSITPNRDSTRIINLFREKKERPSSNQPTNTSSNTFINITPNGFKKEDPLANQNNTYINNSFINNNNNVYVINNTYINIGGGVGLKKEGVEGNSSYLPPNNIRNETKSSNFRVTTYNQDKK